jgi:hypothetical protein
MPLCRSFALPALRVLLLLAALPALCSSRLVGLTFVGFGKGGDNDVALTNVTLRGGKAELSFAPSFPTDDHYGYSCVMAFQAKPRPNYFVISGEGALTRLITIDGLTGEETGSVFLSTQYVAVDMGWNSNDGLIYALASSDYGLNYDIVTIDAHTGFVAVVHAGIHSSFIPRFCESGLSFGSGDPHMYFTSDTNTTDPDDGDQQIWTYDLPSQTIISSVPWKITNGSLNALLAATLPGSKKETLLAIATDPEEHGQRPLLLLSLDVTTGCYTVLGEAPLPAGSAGPLIPSLGSLTVDGSGEVVTTILYDDSQSVFYLASWNVSHQAAGGDSFGAPLSFVPVETPSAGGMWDVQWVADD